MNSFKKYFIDEENNFKIGYFYNNKFQKYINADKPLYLDWLESGNVPEEISYIAPTPLSKEQLIANITPNITKKYNNLTYSNFEYPVASGVVYAGDKESMNLLKESVQMFNILGVVPEDFKWWDIDDIRHSFTYEEFIVMFLARGALKEEMIVQARDDKDLLELMTVSELLIYEV